MTTQRGNGYEKMVSKWNLATWNAMRLYGIEVELEKEFIKANIDILAITETTI